MNVPAKKVDFRRPKLRRELAYFEHFLKTRDKHKSAQLAGYKNPGDSSQKLHQKYPEYVASLIDKYSENVSKQIGYDQRDLLDEMAAIAFANPLDYIEVKIETIDGKDVPKMTQRPLQELSRREAAAVRRVQIKDGVITYQIPDPRHRFPYIMALAKNLGLMNDKLIMEHRHAHIHKDISFQQADPKELEKLEAILMNMIGEDAHKLLGLKKVE